MPRSAARAAIARVWTGSDVVKSYSTSPGAACASTPSGPSKQAAISGVAGTMKKMVLQEAAISPGVATSTPGSAASASRAAGETSQTASGRPARWKLRAMPPPMLPRPTTPTFRSSILPPRAMCELG